MYSCHPAGVCILREQGEPTNNSPLIGSQFPHRPSVFIQCLY